MRRRWRVKRVLDRLQRGMKTLSGSGGSGGWEV